MLDQDIGSGKELYRCLKIPIKLDIRSRNESWIKRMKNLKYQNSEWPYSCTRGIIMLSLLYKFY